MIAVKEGSIRENFLHRLTILLIITPLLLLYFLVIGQPVQAVERNIMFPVLGGGSYTNDYLGSRPNGPHHATDIFAHKHTPLVAAVDGTITFARYPQPSWGYMVQITDADGYEYNYIHMNNDTPGTDDGRGGGMHAYAADMKEGNRVVKGQLVGYLGDSGNAETTPPHLHFEIYRPNDTPVNPYEVLKVAPIRYTIQNRSEYPQLEDENIPYGPYEIGLHLDAGNIDGDAASEVITGAGRGGGPHVKLFDSNMAFTGKHFFAYNMDFTGGVDVATGDIDGDNIDEIITAPGPSGGPNIKVFNTNGIAIASFFAYDPSFTGGVYVTAGDVDGDGLDEIITGPGTGGGPNIKVFEGNGQQIASSLAYTPEFTGGVDVASSDVVGDAKAEIITGAGPGGGPHVRIASYTGNPSTPIQYTDNFFAYDAQKYHGGVRVSAGNVRTSSAKSEILTAPQSYGGPHIKMYDGTGSLLTGKMFMEEWWYGFHDITAGEGMSLAGTGVNRRASVRAAF